jgi:hypothetical protein
VSVEWVFEIKSGGSCESIRRKLAKKGADVGSTFLQLFQHNRILHYFNYVDFLDHDPSPVSSLLSLTIDEFEDYPTETM